MNFNKARTSEWLKKLKTCSFDEKSAKRQLQWLIEHAMFRKMAFPGTERFRRFPRLAQLDEHDAIRVERWIEEICTQSKPLSYIIGTQPFLGWNVTLKKPLLIPRWETEEWVEKIIETLQRLPLFPDKIKILDIGTGTGCIGCSLANSVPNCNVTLVDKSSLAIKIARINSKRLKLSSDQIRFVQGDATDEAFLSKLGTLIGPFDFIVSNPPYVEPEELALIDRSVIDWEDLEALVPIQQSKKLSGTYIHKKIIDNLSGFLSKRVKNVPQLYMEIGGSHQAKKLTQLVSSTYKSDWECSVWKDSDNKDRVFTMKRRFQS